MEISGPRLRSLLRQAERNAQSGKLVAAADLYHQIIVEAPDSVDAWLGLADVSQDSAEKEKAYQQVLVLDPTNEAAQRGLDILHGAIVPVPEPAAAEPEPEVVIETAVVPPTDTITHDHEAVAEEEFDLVCYRHPDRNTSLRCYNCSKPICIECTNKTPVGYLCPDCFKEKEDAFFNNKSTDYIIAALVAVPLSLLVGFVLTLLLGTGFFVWLIIFFVGAGVGSFIGRMTKRAIGNRRGRYIPYLVAVSVIFGVLFFFWPALITLNLGALIAPGIYLFIATPAAFYWSR
ncbi:MAG: hypothetical protein KDE48_20330 [Anaerolineales bacterium]|nr:hypothetical protein [Anaerolineales bacterium]